MAQARCVTEQCRIEYDLDRPQSRLGCLTLLAKKEKIDN
jgi:hypothetical protein